MTITRELNTVKDLVSHILETKPHTRNSDTQLYIEACKHMGAKTIEDMEKMNLSIISVHKIRQVIQNKEGLFLADEEVKTERSRRRWEVKDYMSRIKNNTEESVSE